MSKAVFKYSNKPSYSIGYTKKIICKHLNMFVNISFLTISGRTEEPMAGERFSLHNDQLKEGSIYEPFNLLLISRNNQDCNDGSVKK